MDHNRNILIFGETDGDELSPMTTQLMKIGKELSEKLGFPMYLLFPGGTRHDSWELGFGYGAEKVFAALDPLLARYTTDAYLQVMEQIAREIKPSAILFGHNDIGLDLAPRLAFRLGTGITLDCIDLRIDSENNLFEQVKPVFGGKAQGHFKVVNSFPQIFSIRDRTYESAEYDESKKGDIVELDISLDPSAIRTKFLKKQQDENLAMIMKLNSAEIVVSGGRGLKKKEGVDFIQETAELLDGAIAGSRPAVDHGWIPSSLQVGLTGRKVTPKVYIAVGISGALQHMAGCLKSKRIVAINSDESAPIFKYADFGVIGDYREVLKGLNDEIRRNEDS